MEAVCLLFSDCGSTSNFYVLSMRALFGFFAWMQLIITAGRNFSNWLDFSPIFQCLFYQSLMYSPFAQCEIDAHLN